LFGNNYIVSKVLLVMSARAPNCPCPKKDCLRHGDCQECVYHHKAKNEDPYCAR